MIQSPIKISLFSIPHCFTLSAFAKNFIARATSINPKTTFTSFSQPPDFGIDWIQFGNMANNAKGKPKAMPNPAAPAVSGHAPWSATPVNKVPSIGPVQEKDTMARVNAIKKMPPQLPIPDFECARFTIPLGSVSSNKPKNDKANTIKMRKKIIFSKTLVEILLNISGFVFPAIWNGTVSNT